MTDDNFKKTVIDFQRDGKLPKIPASGIKLIALIAVVGLTLVTSYFMIGPEEVGVVVRFGAYQRTVNPGLHFKLPFGVESVVKVPVERQQKAEFGFRGARGQSGARRFEEESEMLTGDLNAAVVDWVVQYRIVDPEKFLFRVRNPQETLRDMSEAVMRKVVGNRTVNEVLTVGRQEIADLVEQRLQELCDDYQTGMKLEQVVLQDVNPPPEVRPSFNEVNEAQQEREKLINQAQAQYNKVIPKARGQALQTVEEAEGYKLDRVNRARGESARFQSIYAEYRKAPEVTRKRMYLERMAVVMTATGRKLIVDEDARGILPLLNLEATPSRTPQKENR